MGAGPDGSHEKNITITTPFITTTPEYNETAAAIEFYKTYDVMTGIRIAATLGGFFGLMVILVLYKSKSKTEKALEDPDFTAAAVAEVEEEERQLAAALEASAYQELNPRKSRRSLDTGMPPGWGKSTTRFSSVGGYSSLLEPPIKVHSRLPSSIDEDSPPEEDRSIYEDVYYDRHLDVPRRPSNITCSSSGSSYLERRDSAVVLGVPALPAHKSRGRRRQSSPLPEIYDFYYPIDIRVIQPTPGGSPCGSDRAIYDHVTDPPNLKPRLAPLASISSCNSSLGGPDYPEDIQSYDASDSVFQDGLDEDTDDEVEPFSTDSDVNSDEQGACCSTGRRSRVLCESIVVTPCNERPPCVLPINISMKSDSRSSVTLVESPAEIELSCTDSIRRLSPSSITEDKISWAQETLF